MSFFNKLFSLKKGYLYLKLSILLIQVIPTISAVLAIISSSIGFFNTKNYYFKDKNNLPFLVAGFLLVFSCLTNNINDWGIPMKYPLNIGFDNWIGLFNWIPYFYVFWGLQYFLQNERSRLEATYCFLIGSLPVLISGLGQNFFNINGPYRFFNNLIVIFQRPLCSSIKESDLINVDCVSGITSFYNNPNYYGTYLLIILPLSLSILIYHFNKRHLQYFLPFSLIILYSIFLTNSRNALLGAFLSLKIFLDNILKLSFLKRFFSTLALTLFLLLVFLLIVRSNIEFIPETLKDKLLSINLANISASPRLRIWSKSLEMIQARPIFGWGVNAFKYFYNLNSNYLIQSHSHNIISEIALNYGLPSALLIYINFLYLSTKSLINTQTIFKSKDIRKKIINLGWSLSAFIICITFLFDMTYYDYKIAISFWIILAGTKSINETYKNNLNTNNN